MMPSENLLSRSSDHIERVQKIGASGITGRRLGLDCQRWGATRMISRQLGLLHTYHRFCSSQCDCHEIAASLSSSGRGEALFS